MAAAGGRRRRGSVGAGHAGGASRVAELGARHAAAADNAVLEPGGHTSRENVSVGISQISYFEAKFHRNKALYRKIRLLK